MFEYVNDLSDEYCIETNNSCELKKILCNKFPCSLIKSVLNEDWCFFKIIITNLGRLPIDEKWLYNQSVKQKKILAFGCCISYVSDNELLPAIIRFKILPSNHTMESYISNFNINKILDGSYIKADKSDNDPDTIKYLEDITVIPCKLILKLYVDKNINSLCEICKKQSACLISFKKTCANCIFTNSQNLLIYQGDIIASLKEIEIYLFTCYKNKNKKTIVKNGNKKRFISQRTSKKI